ncbi:hypothetical protein L1987_64094 [Smallanthus sonchifolius]|uniref:Uncharacterized protein n=1 Tax=Smallanthus sonchifolius TaxID=185202 RepID=A0ACB9CF43_9ASTR|nr:hypothetical protein L1987_64094 [Smallanthus sonchifolius]
MVRLSRGTTGVRCGEGRDESGVLHGSCGAQWVSSGDVGRLGLLPDEEDDVTCVVVHGKEAEDEEEGGIGGVTRYARTRYYVFIVVFMTRQTGFVKDEVLREVTKGDDVQQDSDELGVCRMPRRGRRDEVSVALTYLGLGAVLPGLVCKHS